MSARTILSAARQLSVLGGLSCCRRVDLGESHAKIDKFMSIFLGSVTSVPPIGKCGRVVFARKVGLVREGRNKIIDQHMISKVDAPEGSPKSVNTRAIHTSETDSAEQVSPQDQIFFRSAARRSVFFGTRGAESAQPRRRCLRLVFSRPAPTRTWLSARRQLCPPTANCVRADKLVRPGRCVPAET